MRMIGLGLALLLGCGSSPRRDLPTGPPGATRVLRDAGYRMVWPWTDIELDEFGIRHDEYALRGGSCLAVVVADEEVRIVAGGVRGSNSSGASWIVGCVAEDGVIEINLRGPPGGIALLGMFVGPPEANGHILLAEHFQIALPHAERPASTLQVQENTCDEDEAREHYRRGMELARAEELEEASAALALAYACNADGTILFNLATVTAQRGRGHEAREMFGQLLRDHPGLPESLRVEVEAALDRLMRPGTMQVRVEPGDGLFVNGVSIALQDGVPTATVHAVPGTHVVRVRSAVGVRHEVRVQLRTGQELQVDPRHRVESE